MIPQHCKVLLMQQQMVFLGVALWFCHQEPQSLPFLFQLPCRVEKWQEDVAVVHDGRTRLVTEGVVD